MPEHVRLCLDRSTECTMWWCSNCGSVQSVDVAVCLNKEVEECPGTLEKGGVPVWGEQERILVAW
jgi:hypothetical protein